MSMAQPLQIQGGVAVITGAASGIGTGLARKARALGMRLVLADVQERSLRDFAATLGGEVEAVPTDVADPAAVERLAERAYARFGQVDLLFNNAGVLTTGFSWEIEPGRWQRSLEINVHGVLHGLRSFVPRLLRAGRPAHIVNTASVGGFLPSPLMAPYSVSKFAVVALTESLRGELEMLQAPVGVSLLAPGPVKTGIFNDPFGPQAGPAAKAFVDNMRSMLEQHGLTPDQFAEPVFAGIAAGQYWLIPQPEAFDEAFRQRNEGILARSNPRIPW
jgi:NAD(P)-dependent dehydrogenase (short-subunit alcohol dehydrogenase family)